MTVKINQPHPVPEVRQAFIPTDLSYLTETEFGQEMMRLAEEIAQEQGTRSTEEIDRLVRMMRGSNSIHVALP
jgi:hypothetical protein